MLVFGHTGIALGIFGLSYRLLSGCFSKCTRKENKIFVSEKQGRLMIKTKLQKRYSYINLSIINFA